MANELDNKRMSDDELEAVSGGVTAQTVDPAAMAAHLMQSQLNAALAVATGGGHVSASTSTEHTSTSHVADTKSQGHFQSITVTNGGSSDWGGIDNSSQIVKSGGAR